MFNKSVCSECTLALLFCKYLAYYFLKLRDIGCKPLHGLLIASTMLLEKVGDNLAGGRSARWLPDQILKVLAALQSDTTTVRKSKHRMHYAQRLLQQASM
jgi:hypothetical protein